MSFLLSLIEARVFYETLSSVVGFIEFDLLLNASSTVLVSLARTRKSLSGFVLYRTITVSGQLALIGSILAFYIAYEFCFRFVGDDSDTSVFCLSSETSVSPTKLSVARRIRIDDFS